MLETLARDLPFCNAIYWSSLNYGFPTAPYISYQIPIGSFSRYDYSFKTNSTVIVILADPVGVKMHVAWDAQRFAGFHARFQQRKSDCVEQSNAILFSFTEKRTDQDFAREPIPLPIIVKLLIECYIQYIREFVHTDIPFYFCYCSDLSSTLLWSGELQKYLNVYHKSFIHMLRIFYKIF